MDSRLVRAEKAIRLGNLVQLLGEIRHQTKTTTATRDDEDQDLLRQTMPWNQTKIIQKQQRTQNFRQNHFSTSNLANDYSSSRMLAFTFKPVWTLDVWLNQHSQTWIKAAIDRSTSTKSCSGEQQQIIIFFNRDWLLLAEGIPSITKQTEMFREFT